MSLRTYVNLKVRNSSELSYMSLRFFPLTPFHLSVTSSIIRPLCSSDHKLNSKWTSPSSLPQQQQQQLLF